MPTGVRRIAFATFFTSVAALVAASAAFAGSGGFLPPTPHSPNAQRIVDAYWVVAGFTGAIFILVEGALIAFIIKYRRGKRPRTAEGLQLHEARDRLDGGAGHHPRDHRVVRLLQAARYRRRAEGARRGRDDDRRRGPSVLLAVPLPERG